MFISKHCEATVKSIMNTKLKWNASNCCWAIFLTLICQEIFIHRAQSNIIQAGQQRSKCYCLTLGCGCLICSMYIEQAIFYKAILYYTSLAFLCLGKGKTEGELERSYVSWELPPNMFTYHQRAECSCRNSLAGPTGTTYWSAHEMLRDKTSYCCWEDCGWGLHTLRVLIHSMPELCTICNCRGWHRHCSQTLTSGCRNSGIPGKYPLNFSLLICDVVLLRISTT